MSDETVLNQLRSGKLPAMVNWFNPRELARISVRTTISTVIGAYADQRLTQAATDPGTITDIPLRYDYSDLNATDPWKRVQPDPNGAVWVDYMADTGDGFESTYTMAYLLAIDTLKVTLPGNKGTENLRHGDILILGGDQCYPQGTRENYRKRLVDPMRWAYDIPLPERKLFAIPGNHDWYDGLAAFDSLFCSSRDKLSKNHGEAFGGWQCQQHRSYWAMHLPYNWWIWGCDIQFSKYLDAAQVGYFELMARQMQPGDKLILCIAEPAWTLADLGKLDEEENFYKITKIALAAGAEICAVVAGDWHHYARYEDKKIGVQFITAGGGGSFLHPTHILKDHIAVTWPKPVASHEPAVPGGYGPPVPGGFEAEKRDISLKNAKSSLLSKAAPVVGEAVEKVQETVADAEQKFGEVVRGAPSGPVISSATAPKCYPSRGRSIWLSLGNLLFPFKNFMFAMAIGLVYWFVTWEFYSIVARHDISGGEIDGVGVHVPFWDVFAYTPLYLMQALLVSIPLAVILFALWAGLVNYVDAGNKPGFRRGFKKFFYGTLHWGAHMSAMFALGLVFVMVNNWVAPRLLPAADKAFAVIAKGGGGMIGSAAKKALEPISEQRQAQRKMFDEENADVVGPRRSAPPRSAMPSAEGPGTPPDKLNPKAFRQLIGFLLYPFQIIVFGGFVGGAILGLYWVLMGFLRMHAEQAFAALRIPHYTNFLRFKFEKDQLTIYPLGVDRIPKRSFWMAREGARHVPLHRPHLIAKREIPVKLIESPIVIKSRRAGT